jgi:hypothetical protein
VHVITYPRVDGTVMHIMLEGLLRGAVFFLDIDGMELIMEPNRTILGKS